MNCQEVQTRIGDALAAVTTVPADVLAHRESCTACREFYEAHQKLFSLLDVGLGAVANRPMPPSLLPKVRERIEVAKPGRAWLVRWAPVGAAVVLACVVAVPLIHQGDRKTDPNIARPMGQQGHETVLQGRSEPPVVAKPSMTPDVARVARNKRGASRTTSIRTRMEVIFDKEEARGLSRLVRSIDQRPALGQGFLNAATLPSDETKPTAPIEIAELNIAPLTDESR